MGLPGITTHVFTDPVLRGSILEAFRVEREGEKWVWKECGFDEMSSNKAFEEITEFAGMGLAARREELAQGTTDSIKQGFTTRVNIFSYAINFPISREAQMRKEINKVVQGTKSVMESLRYTVEVVCADLLGNGFSTTTGITLPDTKAIFATDHTLPRGGTYSNKITAASVSEEGVEAMSILAGRMVGGHGLPTKHTLKKIVIPVEQRFEARRVLKSDKQNWTSNNAINAIKEDNIVPVENEFLPSTSNWFGVTNAKQGAVLIWGEQPNVTEVGMDLNRAVVWSGNMMFGIGVPGPRRWIGSEF